MFSNVLKAIFGSRNDRLLKQYRKTVESINALEPAIEKLSDEALAAKTPELQAEGRRRRAARRGPPRGLRRRARGLASACSACATSTCSSIGGIALHQGKIAEMRTGEGKTLVATLPVVPERARPARACTWSR